MNQNSIIAFAMITGFVVFITVRGELPAYLAILGLGAGASSTPSNSTGGFTLPSLNNLGGGNNGITTGPNVTGSGGGGITTGPNITGSGGGGITTGPNPL